MIRTSRTSVLFTGYAPVHFVCFRPLYERLTASPGFEGYVSGGLREQRGTETFYDQPGMYQPFGLPQEQILPVDEMRRREFDVLIGANTKLISPRNAGKRVQIFHGISFRNKAVRDENMACDHYFIIGPYMHRRFVESGLLAENDPRAIKIGFPKTDALLDGSLNRNESLRRYGFNGERPVIVYAPTGQLHNSLETRGEDVIRRLATSGRFDLLIKPHDHPKNTAIDWFSRLAVLEDAHTRVVRDRDVVPLLFLADLLITDASSVSSEYSLLDRPMVFLDVPELLESSARKDAMLDLETWGRHAGTIVEKSEDVVDAVVSALANPSEHSETRHAMARDLFYNPGSATSAAMAWFEKTFG